MLGEVAAQVVWVLRLLDVVRDVLLQRLGMITMVKGRDCSLAYVGRKRAVEFRAGVCLPKHETSSELKHRTY